MVSRSLTSLSTPGAGIQIFEIHFAVPVPPSADSWKKLMLTIAQNWEWRERCQMEVCHDWMAWSFVPISNTFVMFAVGKTESLEGSCLSSGALEVRKSNTLQSLITLLASCRAQLNSTSDSNPPYTQIITEVVPSRLHFKYKRILLAWEFAEKHLFRFSEKYSLQCIGPSTLKLWLINSSALLRLTQWLFLSLDYHSKVH